MEVIKEALFRSLDQSLSSLGYQNKNTVIAYLEQSGINYTAEELDLRRAWNILRTLFGQYAEVVMSQTNDALRRELGIGQQDETSSGTEPSYEKISRLLSRLKSQAEAIAEADTEASTAPPADTAATTTTNATLAT